jgi:hypothetical protein
MGGREKGPKLSTLKKIGVVPLADLCHNFPLAVPIEILF